MFIERYDKQIASIIDKWVKNEEYNPLCWACEKEITKDGYLIPVKGIFHYFCSRRCIKKAMSKDYIKPRRRIE